MIFWFSYRGLEPHLDCAHAGHTQGAGAKHRGYPVVGAFRNSNPPPRLDAPPRPGGRHSLVVRLTSSASPAMNSTRSLFIIAAIPFSLLAVLLLFLDKAFRTGGSTGSSMVFVFCGGVYIYGSIYALRGHLPLS